MILRDTLISALTPLSGGKLETDEVPRSLEAAPDRGIPRSAFAFNECEL